MKGQVLDNALKYVKQYYSFQQNIQKANMLVYNVKEKQKIEKQRRCQYCDNQTLRINSTCTVNIKHTKKIKTTNRNKAKEASKDNE